MQTTQTTQTWSARYDNGVSFFITGTDYDEASANAADVIANWFAEPGVPLPCIIELYVEVE